MAGFRIMMVLLCMALVAPAPSFAAEDAPRVTNPDFEYLELKPLVVPVITPSGVTQQVSLIISLEIPFGMRETIRVKEPRLTDAYLRDLYGILGAGGLMKKGIVDAVAVKQRLVSATEKVLEPEEFKDVLLQVVQQTYR